MKTVCMSMCVAMYSVALQYLMNINFAVLKVLRLKAVKFYFYQVV